MLSAFMFSDAYTDVMDCGCISIKKINMFLENWLFYTVLHLAIDLLPYIGLTADGQDICGIMKPDIPL